MDCRLVSAVFKIKLSDKDGPTDGTSAEEAFRVLQMFPELVGTISDRSTGTVMTVREILDIDPSASTGEKTAAAKDSARRIGKACELKWEIVTEDGELLEDSDYQFFAPGVV